MLWNAVFYVMGMLTTLVALCLCAAADDERKGS